MNFVEVVIDKFPDVSCSSICVNQVKVLAVIPLFLFLFYIIFHTHLHNNSQSTAVFTDGADYSKRLKYLS